MADYHDLGLRRAARQVCEALSEYVTVLEQSSGQPVEVVAGMDLVGEACAAFVALSIDTTGWGNPFAPQPEPATEAEDEASPQLPGDKDQLVEVTTQYLIRCPDPWIAGQFVRRQLRERGVPIVSDEIDTVTGIAQVLEDLDGWRPDHYTHDSKQVFELIEKSWQIRRRG